MSHTFPRNHFPEWWNINTHRCNHLGRLPTYQDSYGFGRSFVADWGRIGGVNIVLNDEVRIDSQISTAIAGQLHSPQIPEPLLHPYYRGDPESDRDDYCDETQTDQRTTDFVTARHYGFKHLLDDPVLTGEASSAFLFGKIQGLLRRNIPATIHESGPYYRFVSELISQAKTGLQCSSVDEQNRVLARIQQLLDSSKPNQMQSNGITQSPDKTPRRKRSKSTISGGHCPLQPTLKKLLYPPNVDGNPSTNQYTRFLASFDPILIRRCAFPNNPDYLGNGLVSTVRCPFADDPDQHSPVLVWSPPKSDSIYYANLSDFDEGPLKFCSLQLPSKICTPSLTELVVQHASSGHIDLLTRGLPHNQNASFIRLKSEHPDRLELSLGDVHNPLLPGHATSVCLNPWLAGEWSAAGYFTSPSGDRTGFVRIYDVEQPNRAIWSGQLIVDSCLDEIRLEHEALLRSADLSTKQQDPVQMDLETYVKDISVHLDQLDSKPHYSWLRLNYGSCPGELALCSPKRILLMDTRQPGQNSTARQLFELPASQHDTKKFGQFNPHERLSCLSTRRWIGDVYLVAGMAYSMIVLDKRMPGRCVLHWSHNLLGSPAYMDWTETEPKQDWMPQYFVPMASQYPAEVGLFGLNFTVPSSVQLVGPSVLAPPLTNLLHRSKTKLPSCLYRHETIHSRLQSSLCGITILKLRPRQLADDEDEDTMENPIFQTVSLTSMGDLFSHSWYLEPKQADRKSIKIDSTVSSWLSNLSHITKVSPDKVESAQPVHSVFVEGQLRLNDLNQVCHSSDPVTRTKSNDEPLFWSLENLPQTTSSEFENSSSERVQCSKHLIKDLNTIWDVAGSDQVANFVKYLPPELLTLSGDRTSEEDERKHKSDCPDTASQERLDRLRSVVRTMFYDSAAEQSDSDDDDSSDCEDEDQESLGVDVDASLFAPSEASSMNLSSPD